MEAGERKEEWKRAEIETLLTVLHIEIISNCAGARSGGRGEEANESRVGQIKQVKELGWVKSNKRK